MLSFISLFYWAVVAFLFPGSAPCSQTNCNVFRFFIYPPSVFVYLGVLLTYVFYIHIVLKDNYWKLLVMALIAPYWGYFLLNIWNWVSNLFQH